MEDPKYQLRLCPTCRTAPTDNSTVRCEVPAESSSFGNLIPYWNGLYSRRTFFSYVRCGVCRLLFSKEYFSSEQLTHLYRQMPANMEEVPKEALRATQNGYFKFIENIEVDFGNYLELGPDIGIFTEICANQKNFNKYFLIEPNEGVADELSAKLESKNFTIIQDFSSLDEIPEKSLSLVVMIHVLDHLLDPTETLRTIKTKMMRGGVLLLVTHNELSLLSRVTRTRWPAYCLQHPQLFNPRSIKEILSRTGFKLESVRRTTNFFTLSFLLRNILWLFGIRKSLNHNLFRKTVGLKLGNILSIAKPYE